MDSLRHQPQSKVSVTSTSICCNYLVLTKFSVLFSKSTEVSKLWLNNLKKGQLWHWQSGNHLLHQRQDLFTQSPSDFWLLSLNYDLFSHSTLFFCFSCCVYLVLKLYGIPPHTPRPKVQSDFVYISDKQLTS